MTTSVKERLVQDWQKVKDQGGTRTSRIQEILKSAASETWSELKAGSADMEMLSREVLAEMLAELATQSDAEVHPQSEDGMQETQVINPDVTAIAAVEEATKESRNVPGWRTLLKGWFGLVRDRKSDWLNLFWTHLQRQMAQFDADMTEEYGDRYQRVKQSFEQIKVWYTSAQQRSVADDVKESAGPIEVEIMTDESPNSGTEPVQ